ncbi:hypothetical protein LCGC14_0043820 [marine sediment metagenome]
MVRVNKYLMACVLTLHATYTLAEPSFPRGDWGPAQRAMLEKKTLLTKGDMAAIPAPPGIETDEGQHELMRVMRIQLDPANGVRRPNARDALEMEVGDLLRKRRVLPDPNIAPTLWSMVSAVDHDVSITVLKEAKRHDRVAPHAVSDDIAEMSGHVVAPAFPSLRFARIRAAMGLLEVLNDQCADDYAHILADTAVDMEFSGQHRASDIRAAELVSAWTLSFVEASEQIRDEKIRAETELAVHLRLEGCPLDPKSKP